MIRWTIALMFVSESLQATRLPLPKGLEDDVSFWQDIFKKYPPDQCVYHDTEELDSIFIVKQVPRSRRSRNRTIRRDTSEIRKALLALARYKSPRNAMEKRVYRGIPKFLRNPRYFKAAASRIRCQRGVDFSRSVARSKNYIPGIKNIFEKEGIPEDLAYLPHLESGFNRKARSKAGARGLWQFIRPMARQFGLQVSRHRDERTDFRKSTRAAAKLLKQLKQEHKTWPLAVTAYNYGTNGMRRAIRKYGHDYMKIRQNHSTSMFGFAVKNYYPSILAVRNLMDEKKGRTSGETYQVQPGDNLTKIAEKFGTSISDIKEINHLRSNKILAGQRLKIGNRRM